MRSAAKVHRLHYEDDHIQLLEVANPPKYPMEMHGHPHPSVFARDSLPPQTGGDTYLDPSSPLNGQAWGTGSAPQGAEFPTCQTADPQAPHRPVNDRGLYPYHFYRIEFKRLDELGLESRWREWYPSLAAPVSATAPASDRIAGPPMSAGWPYAAAYDAPAAAPLNYHTIFENDRARVLEVSIRPGETTPMHGHPFSSVLAFDSLAAFNAMFSGTGITETNLDPSSALNGRGSGRRPHPKAGPCRAA